MLKRDDLKTYIEKEDLDVLCLNETKIDKDTFIRDKVYVNMPPNYFNYW